MPVVTNDAYHWCVIYQDGMELHEFDGPGTIGRGFAEVEHASVETVCLIAAGGERAHEVRVPEDAAPVFFRRRTIHIGLAAQEPEESPAERGTIHCIGWRRAAEQGVYLFVLADGRTLLTDELQAV